MRSYIIAPAWGAIALGVLFCAGTTAVLFWDVRKPSDFTVDHLMTLLVLIGTIASGHMVWRQIRAWRVLPAAGLAFLFVAGTFYCVTTSAARNVETSIPKVLERLDINEQRAKLEADILEAKADLRRATDTVTVQCASGVGPKCAGASKTRDQADSHYWMMIGRLANMKPAQPANPGLAHAAKVFAIMPMTGSPEAIENALVLLFPFAKALFLEIATIVFLGLGFEHRSRPQTVQVIEPKREPQKPFMNREPFNTVHVRVTNPHALAKPVAQRDLLEFIATNGHVPSQEFLRERWGLRSKGTVSVWLGEWERLGFVQRQQDGRVKVTRMGKRPNVRLSQ